MKILIFILLSFNLFAQSELLTLMDSNKPQLTILANMMIWYKGDYGLTSSGWLDASGNSRNLSFTQTAWQPNITGTKNGIPTALFDGSNDRSDSVLFTTTAWTTYIVLKPVTHISFAPFFDGGANQRNAMRQGASDGIVQSFNGGQVQAFAQSIPTGTWYVLVQQLNLGNLRMYNKMNGNALAGGVGIGTADMAGFKLGGYFNNGAFTNFEVAEIILYNAEHDAPTIAIIQGYLNAKYKIY